METKELVVIGGSNGAGKTTFAKEFLPVYAHCPRFINPDLIASGISPFDPASVTIRAGRLMLREISDSILQKRSFAIESTLSGKAYLRILERARKAGYIIRFFYLWVPDPALAVARVQDRVECGGHFVPENDVRRRYIRTLSNFFTKYRQQAHTVHFFDNTGDDPELVFKDEYGFVMVYNHKLYQNLIKKWSIQ